MVYMTLSGICELIQNLRHFMFHIFLHSVFTFGKFPFNPDKFPFFHFIVFHG